MLLQFRSKVDLKADSTLLSLKSCWRESIQAPILYNVAFAFVF
jgi:hypothetical protein